MTLAHLVAGRVVGLCFGQGNVIVSGPENGTALVPAARGPAELGVAALHGSGLTGKLQASGLLRLLAEAVYQWNTLLRELEIWSSAMGTMQMPKTILVTGATGGIGAPLCERLAAAGNNLILAARDASRLHSLSASLSGAGKHRVMPVDMTDDVSVAAFGRDLAQLRVALCGVVLMPPPLPRSTDPLPDSDTWRSHFQASFVGPLALLKLAIEAMHPDIGADRRAKIVIVSAITTVQVLGHYAASNVLRPAWLGQAKTLAFALGRRGIHVNTVSLGGILTAHYSDLIEGRAKDAGQTFQQRLADETSNVPLGKYGRPQEVAAVIDGLLSDFSDHLTGINTLCDGGFTRSL